MENAGRNSDGQTANAPSRVLKLLFFPWAGGTTRIYSSLCKDISKKVLSPSKLLVDASNASSMPTSLGITPLLSQFQVELCPINLPGRLMRPANEGEEVITDFPALANELIREIFLDTNNSTGQNKVLKGEQYVLFGHSFGAILAFEIAKNISDFNIQSPLALFVSASRPPSAGSLTSSTGRPVSEMSFHEMKDYFKSRGSEMDSYEGLTEEFENILAKSIQSDYKCLETYQTNQAVLNCPLYAFGGDQDIIVNVEDTERWKEHTTHTSLVDNHIFVGKGHFYLDDFEVSKNLAEMIVANIEKTLASVNNDTIETLKHIFANVLQMDVKSLSMESDFFECGGSSLDTVVLIFQIHAKMGVHVTQNEFFLNPKVGQLALRVNEIRVSSVAAPILGSVHQNDGQEQWFIASPGQEQMLSCWEIAPVMYNMPTTIKFYDCQVDIVKLSQAFEFIVQQQPSLRTVVAIDSRSNDMKQRVLPLAQAKECFALESFKAKSDEEARKMIESESLFEFNLSEPPVVRGVVVQIENSDNSYFLLNQHHVGADGWSRTQLRRQLLEAYIGLCSDGKIPQSLVIPAHPNYVDWTLWLERWLNDYGQEEKQLDYWKNRLADLPVLNLPTDKPRPAVLSARGARIPILIDSTLTAQFTRFASEKGANLYAGLIAVYMLLLHRLGGGDDFAIGIALANRHHEGMQNLIGYFANEVTIRSIFEEKMTFVELLAMIRTRILEGMANADVAFHKVTEALNFKRDISRSPVFQAMFALQERNWHSLDDINPSDGNINFELKNQNHNTSKFEVHLQLRHDGHGGLEGDLHIATDLFTVESGHRMAKMYVNLLKSCLENPSYMIGRHVIISSADLDLIEKCNDTDKVYEKTTMLDFNASQDDVALVMEGFENVTYGRLQKMISSVADFLLTRKTLQRQDRIGLLIRSSPLALAVIYGVASAGMTAVILDPEKTPVDRCRMIFDDSNVHLVIIDNDFKNTFFEDIADTKSGRKMHTVHEAVEFETKEQIKKESPSENDVFAIFYTSGTTGVPKGVITTHGNVVNLICWWKTFFDIRKKDRILLFSSLSFIMSLRQYIPTLNAGSTIVIPKNALDFESAILHGKVNKLVCTPSALAALDIDRTAESIEAVQVAGEAPLKNTLDAWKARVEKVFIGLGPTELTAHAVCSEYDGKTICIGYPAANVKVYIIDSSTGLQCPVNCVGELTIAGKNVAGGYLNKEKLTKKSFGIDHRSSMRLYRTGDLAKRLPCGRIQFIGRRDNQLKVNGLRMEGGEVINALPACVKKAHVMVRDNVLTLFVTPEDINVDDLKSHLRYKNLPSYMIPTVIHAVDTFPLNKNRKLDVPELLSKVLTGCEEGMSTISDRVDISRTETKLRLIYAQILKKDSHQVSVQDNFFTLGGTSLSAVVVGRLISKNLQVDVSVHDVFIHQNIHAMAKYIDSKSRNVEDSTSDPHPLKYLPGGRHALHPFLFTSLQLLGLILMSIVAIVPIAATIYVSVRSFIWFGDLGVVLFPLFVGAGCFIHILLVTLIKWCTIGRYQVGKAKMFSYYFLKWWLVRRVLQVTQLYTWIFDETPLSGFFFRCLGARVGRNVSVEQPFLFEPDLVEIGNNCVLDFETIFATSEIRNGNLELRKVSIGDNVKVGVRAVFLGGSSVHSNCEVSAKTTVDYFTSSTEEGQLLFGSPAASQLLYANSLREGNSINNQCWRPARSWMFVISQIIAALIMIEIMTVTVYIGAALIGRDVNNRFGNIGLVVYLGSAFQIMSCIVWLFFVAFFKWLLISRLEENKKYASSWFALRKWFLDRMFLSPLFSYASRRVLQTSSTYPWYMKLLGSKIGERAWINHPYIRVGSELISIGDDFHMGMLSYISTDIHKADGISFSRVCIGDSTSFGQRCVALAGAEIGFDVTIGAETVLPYSLKVHPGATAFGSPPVSFLSAATNEDIVEQSQQFADTLLKHDLTSGTRDIDTEVFGSSDNEKNKFSVGFKNQEFRVVSAHNNKEDKTLNDVPRLRSSSRRHPTSKNETVDESSPGRMQDIGSGRYFWFYVSAMILIQCCLPLLIGAAYGSIYYVVKFWLGDEMRIEYVILCIPAIYIIGSVALMLIMKLMQLGAGTFSIGTTNFFSFRFFYWHIFADMIYLCTSTIIYPFSGTEIYCIWLRFMGAKVGKRVFISPENGGFREIDFMTVGDDCCLMTPNIHAHYTDHGKLQFCPVKLEDGCEVNNGATIMPLTMYEKGCRLRPYAVTIKGQSCKENTEYNGNPCKAVKAPNEKVAILFTGQGSQYPGMFQQYSQNSAAQDLLKYASKKLQINIVEICSLSANTATLQDTRIAQPIVFVANLMAAEMMRQKAAIDFSKAIAVAGFSLGELSALCFAGAISLDDSLMLVKVRADTMAACKGGAMCNVRGVSRKDATDLAKSFGCEIANIICDHADNIEKNVYVLAGTATSIDKCVSHINNDVERGSRSAKQIRVSAAFHTKMMKSAQIEFQRALESVKITLPTDYLIYSNITGKPYTSVEEIRKLLPLQIVSSVQWHTILIDMVSMEGIEKFIECGPQDTLSKTVSLILPELKGDQILTSDEGNNT